MQEGIFQLLQVGDVVTRDGSDLHRVIKLPEDWDRLDGMVIAIVECIRASSNGWCAVGDVDDMLVDDLYWPDERAVEGAAVAARRLLKD